MSYPPQILIDIPESRVSEIVESFRRDGAIKITQQQMRSGTWVVTAEFEITPFPREGMLAYMRNPARRKKTIISEAS
ncbi:MAG: hypothetical protein ACOY15_10090 [Pseudomonadota bacterium]